MATWKRYTKTTPTGTQQTYYVVSGAGTSACDGTYTDTGSTHLSAPVYSNGTKYIVSRSDLATGRIGICANSVGDDLQYYWTETDGEITGNITTMFGTAPAPSVTKNSGYSGSADTLFTVASGKADAIISVVLNGGSNGGTVTLYENNGTADFSTQAVTLTANENIVLDYKQFLQAGDIFKVGSTATGINVTVNVYEKDQA